MYCILQIKEIRFAKKGFHGLSNYMTNNIALVILDEKIAMGPTVMPACVDWTGRKKIPPTEDTPGKVYLYYSFNYLDE